ncbi:MAG: MotA/TolQ/ExbB proton channel family protein [Verrucomicrobiia bacterium]
MWAILACSILATGIFAERLLFYRRNTIPVDPFLAGLRNLVRKGRFTEALERCDDVRGPVVRVIQAAILKRHLPKGEVREIVQEVGQMQVPRLEAHLSLLATVGTIAPLLGLLGTVTGMIKAFKEINEAMGAAPIGDLAGGIWEALTTTAGGLVVAIPTYVAYNFLVSRMNGILTDVERAGIEVVHLLYDEAEGSAGDGLDQGREKELGTVKEIKGKESEAGAATPKLT